MPEIRLRPMTAGEFAEFRERAIHEYAAEHVRAGDWSAENAHALATAETDALLPAGAQTPGTLLVMAESPGVGIVGLAWLALSHPQRQGAYIYDIEIMPEHRGRGYGRALLAALEDEARRHGAESIALNVFGDNHVARALYESSGYGVAAVAMRKRLDR
jgi:ribosomal protein S18 acetylase RimI-like enzyme